MDGRIDPSKGLGLKTSIDILSGGYDQDIPYLLLGHQVVEADVETGTLVLDNGVRIEFDKYNDDCCSSIELVDLKTTPALITAAEFRDNEDETGGEGAYKAWLHVITEAGEMNVAEADGDASNGYYLHGFALDAKVILPE